MEQLQPVLDFLLVFWEESQIKWILLTVLVNVVTALAAALTTGNFNFRKTGEFLYKKILLTAACTAHTGLSDRPLT